MDSSDFRRHGHALVEWIAEYLEHPERYPVLPRVSPGDVRDALPVAAPEAGEPFADIIGDFERVLGAPVLLVGFGLPGENAHAPDEWLGVESFTRGMRAIATLWEEYGARPR